MFLDLSFILFKVGSHGGRTGEGLTSPDDHAHVIDDNDDEDSPTDTPDLWMPERNEEDTKFVRSSTDAIPTKTYP